MSTDTINYWWMNTKPGEWNVLDYPVGYEDTERLYSDTGRRQVYKNFKAVSPGDLVIGYETGPTKKVLAVYRITKALYNDLKDGEAIGFRIIERVRKPLHWDDIKIHPVLKNCMPVRVSNKGSLFALTSEEYHTIVGLVG